MSTNVQAIPERYKAATPYLSVDGAARAIEFYKQAFGSVETMRMDGPGGRIMHAEVTIGAAPIMLSDEWPEMGFRSPEAFGGSPVQLYVYVEDVDALADRAVAAGATALRPVGACSLMHACHCCRSAPARPGRISHRGCGLVGAATLRAWRSTTRPSTSRRSSISSSASHPGG